MSLNGILHLPPERAVPNAYRGPFGTHTADVYAERQHTTLLAGSAMPNAEKAVESLTL
jgi:hypothetical protein